MKSINKYIIAAATLVSIYGCGPDGNSFRINGSFKDLKSGELYIYNLSDRQGKVDTVLIKNGEFKYKGNVSETTPYIIVFPNAMEQVIFVNGGEEITYKAAANDLKNYTAEGNEENKMMNEFRQNTAKMNPKQIRNEAEKTIQAHGESAVSLYLFYKYFVQDESVSDSKLLSIIAELKKNHPKDKYILDIESKIKSRKKGIKDSVIPDLTIKTFEDKDIKLKENSGSKCKLLVFWATWTSGSYNLYSKIKDLKNRYGGQLDLIMISLDTQYFKFESYVKTDTTGIKYSCDGLAWDSPAVKDFGVEEIPLFVLVGKDNKIISRKTDFEEMRKEMSKILE